MQCRVSWTNAWNVDCRQLRLTLLLPVNSILESNLNLRIFKFFVINNIARPASDKSKVQYII